VPALSAVEVNVTGFSTTHHCCETNAGAWGKLTFPVLGERGIFRQDFRLTLRGTVDTDLIAFAYYLVHTRSQEDAAAAVTTAAAAS
jgi:hypothetical protein